MFEVYEFGIDKSSEFDTYVGAYRYWEYLISLGLNAILIG